MNTILSKSTASQFIEIEAQYGAHNYHPLPVVLERGEGVHLWDVNGKQYYDFLSAYSAVNQGHCHPKIINALVTQAQKLCLTSRAFYNDQLGSYEKYITQLFGYDKVLPMNTGAEGVETAIKLCRKWAYLIKKIPENQAKIIVFEGNFHGRTMSAVSASTDPTSYKNFGPFLPGFIKIPYNDLSSLEHAISQEHVAGILIEPIQGEAGVIIPSDDFLKTAYALCKSYNVLFIADEIQTGIARTGKMLACDHVAIKPDILILGKALSGGVLPISAILTSNEIMLCIQAGEHGSTFGGNPLAAAVAKASLEVILEEGLIENAKEMGEILRSELTSIQQKNRLIKTVRGKGLLNAIVIDTDENSEIAWKICLEMAKNGLLAKPTHGNIIRLAPPLCITKEQILEASFMIQKAIHSFS
ncbi:MAG: ornithine--oxo-acid transaminase [Saprospiraceae bacterium]|nr:ornithine--oxo-acid transaminase [Saprospiraceae bacterium]